MSLIEEIRKQSEINEKLDKEREEKLRMKEINDRIEKERDRQRELERMKERALERARERSVERHRGSQRSRSRSRDRRISRDGSRDRNRRSRSHDRGSYRSRSRPYRSRSRDRSRSHRRSRSHSQSGRRSRSQSSESDRIGTSTNSSNPNLLKSRVFIGNLPSEKITREDLEEMFTKYGKVTGISLLKGFGFIQFSDEEVARKAVAAEQGSLLKGSVVDIKMAAEGRNQRGRPQPRDRPRVPDGPPGRDRSPIRDAPRDPLRDPYDRYPPPPRDPYRRDDPYARRDPYADDPYRRLLPPRDPFLDRYRDDPYRRDPYAAPDPYRDPYRDAALPPPLPARDPEPERPPYECEIIALSAQQRGYAEMIERRLKALKILTKITVLAEDVKELTLQRVLEESSRRGVLYAINISSQNEVHRSLTLNILHGTPQEHRNMPLDDAVSLINRNFEAYVKALQEKRAAAAAPPVVPPAVLKPPTSGRYAGFTPPDGELTYLLNLLADKRQLTLDEIEKVLGYLRIRRDQQIEAEGGIPLSKAAGVDDIKTKLGATFHDDKAVNDQQQELQAKILSILNGAGPGQTTPTAPAGTNQNAYAGNRSGSQYPTSQGQAVLGRQAPPAPPPSAPGGTATSINFDNPSVQRALDNLISSGPNLLRNISSATGPNTNQQKPMVSNAMMGSHMPSQLTAGGMTDMARQAHSQSMQVPSANNIRPNMAPAPPRYPPTQQLRY